MYQRVGMWVIRVNAENNTVLNRIVNKGGHRKRTRKEREDASVHVMQELLGLGRIDPNSFCCTRNTEVEERGTLTSRVRGVGLTRP